MSSQNPKAIPPPTTVKHSKRDTLLRWWAMLSGYAVIASLVMHITLTDTSFHFHDPDSQVAFHKMVQGQVHRPFAYRIAAPFSIRVMSNMTPTSVKDRLSAFWNSKLSLATYGYTGEYATEYTWGVLLLYLSLLVFGLLMYTLLGEFFPVPRLTRYLASIACVAFVPIGRSFFVYDYPNLAVFTACILAMYKRNWSAFYPLFLVACLTKETSILLTIIYVLNIRNNIRSSKNIAHAACQLAIWILLFLLLRVGMAEEGGALMEFHLLDYNLPLLLKPSSYFNFGPSLLPRGINILLICSAVVFTVSYWRYKPLFVRRSLSILAFLLGLALFGGWIDELRMYYEAYPLIACAGFHTLLSLPWTPTQPAEQSN